MSLELLVSFVTAFTLWFLILPYARLYLNPKLPRKYKVPEDTYDDLGVCLIVSSIFLMLGFSFLPITWTPSHPWVSWVPEISGVFLGTGFGVSLHPLYLLHLIRKKQKEESKIVEFRKFDKLVIELATKRGGVLSPLHLVKELGVTIENAVDLLERFVKLEVENVRVARKKEVKGVTIYVFPTIISDLAEIHRKIVEILIEHPEGLTKPELLIKTNLPLETFEESISRLEPDIIIHNKLECRYRLRGLTY